ncbi:hypothetical protein PCANC_17364 [Puccinia coronata f. sp. avenae]|uniref:DUF159-domain-containing protein n=1 Tax=Puccinia coronata f. sp. avenae TaxID=200324 RepID=A0A2N5U509_9BASI|nr:hypothetical protein PCANC_17364 [Puccinia coronata f. sp. avenae]
MCGRFALSISAEEVNAKLKQDMKLDVDSWLNAEEYRTNFNLAPQNRAAVLRRINPQENRLGIDCMKWGLVPHWTESPPTHGSLLNTINARDDKVVAPRGLWNTVKGKKRCVILCEGFFEWLNKGKDKIPHFTKRTGAGDPLMCLAGLWDSVTYQGSTEELHTFTIITTTSNQYLSFLHDRMPVILADEESITTWLDTSSGQWSDNLAKLLKPFDLPDGLVSYPVPKEVGKVGNQSPDFLKPISQRKGNIMSFFNRQAPAQGPPSVKASSSTQMKKEERQGPDGVADRLRPVADDLHDNQQAIIKDEEHKQPASSSSVSSPTPTNSLMKRVAGSAEPDQSSIHLDKRARKIT